MLREEQRLRMFLIRVPRVIFVPKKRRRQRWEGNTKVYLKGIGCGLDSSALG
jgi:hypothetical protein